MRKYWALYKVSVQNTLTYRGPLLVWLLANLIGLAVVLSVWFAAEAGGTIGGYTRSELITYYIFSLFLSWLVQWMPFYWIKDEIANGDIVSSSLLKPVSFFFKTFAHEAGWHTVSVFVGAVPSVLIGLFLGDYFIWHLGWLSSLEVLLAIFLAAMVTMAFSLCMGLVSFWTTRVGPLDSLYWMARMFLGGQGVPISFFPAFFQPLVTSLPFRYMFSFPIELYLGRLTVNEISFGFAVGLIWLGIFTLLYKWMWNQGRLAYTAFGH